MHLLAGRPIEAQRCQHCHFVPRSSVPARIALFVPAVCTGCWYRRWAPLVMAFTNTSSTPLLSLMAASRRSPLEHLRWSVHTIRAGYKDIVGYSTCTRTGRRRFPQPDWRRSNDDVVSPTRGLRTRKNHAALNVVDVFSAHWLWRDFSRDKEQTVWTTRVWPTR